MNDSEQLRRSIGRQIAAARRARGLSQNRLAREMGGPPYIEASQVSRWERGLVFPSWRNFDRLAGALGVPVERFFEPLEGT